LNTGTKDPITFISIQAVIQLTREIYDITALTACTARGIET
jgi:hypothetical protein